MIVEYELTEHDLQAFNLYHQRHSPALRRNYLRGWFVPAFVWLLACTVIWHLADRSRGTPVRTFLDLLPLFAGVPVYLLLFPWMHRRALRRTVARLIGEGRNRGVFTRHRVALSPEGINESSEFEQNSVSWRAVERVVQHDDHAFVYVNSLSAVIIPRRAFATAAEFEHFISTARSHHEAA